MPFVKFKKKVKGLRYKKGDIVLIEDDEIRDGISITSKGEEVPTDAVVPLTPEEEAECLEVQEIPI